MTAAKPEAQPAPASDDHEVDAGRVAADLRAAAERFHLLVDAATDYAIFLLDSEGRIVTWNAGAERIKGYRAEEVIGQHVEMFFLPEDRLAGKPQRNLAAARESGRFEDEGWRLRKDGSRFWANAILTILRGPGGEIVGFAKVTRDLTERLQAAETERRLLHEQAARAAVEQASREKDEFLAVVSHELRTPLTAILGWSAILRDRPDHPSAGKAVAAVARNAQALSHLIEDLLDVSRIVTGKLSLELADVDLGDVATDAVETLRPAAQSKGVELQLTVAERVHGIVGDPDRLRQVCTNLVGNALKFTPAAGRVDVSVDQVGSEVILVVRDSGAGIAPELLPHVFERFRQGDASTTRRTGGLGLGLSIVQHVVQRHGGSVVAASEGRDHGATFTVRLPIRAVMPSDRGDSAAPASRPSLAGLRVLLVDDDDDAREMIGAVLSASGAEILSASSAAQGLALTIAHHPHLLISDIGMPGQDGYSFVAQMRTLDPPASWTPAIALTAYARAEDKRAALRAGFNAHLGKPVNPEHLVDLVADVVKSVRR